MPPQFLPMMIRLRTIGVVLATTLLLVAHSGCQTAPYRAGSLPPNLLAKPSPSHRNLQLKNLAAQGQNSSRIAAGDLLEVHLASGAEEEPPKPHMARVGEDGSVTLPLLGSVTVVGREPAAASEVIAKAAIGRGVYRRPSVTVAVKEQATNQVMVLGAVTEPGLHNLPKNSSDVLSAIAAAGGLTDEAGVEVEVMRQSRTYLAKNDQSSEPAEDGVQPASYTQAGSTRTTGHEVERINLAQATSRPHATRTLNEHDVVMVLPREKNVIHVTGLVTRPDQFEMPDEHELRLLDAIALAGGRSSNVADKVIVLRQPLDGGEPVAISASLSAAKQNSHENLVLAPGDLVSVESTFATATLNTVKDFFRITMGVSSRLTAF